jgi:endonuclease-3
MSRNTTELARRAECVLDALEKAHPDARIYLDFESPFQLLIATILAAQCRDETINQLTPELFRRCPDPAALAGASEKELQRLIKPSGFFRRKAVAIREVGRALADEYDGEVPDDMDRLAALPGVGRKTAAVVLGNAFGVPAIAVDTHVQRVSLRIGLARKKQPDKIEQELCDVIRRERWIRATQLIGTHGRRICFARKPRCPDCPVSQWCDYFQTHGAD